MGQTCKVCSHPRRDEIDAALLAKASIRDVSGQFSVSKSAVQRHRAHVSQRLARAAEAQEIASADSLAAQLKLLQGKAEQFMVQAAAAKDLRTALLAIRELSRLIELTIKTAPESGTGDPAQLTIITQSPEPDSVMRRSPSSFPGPEIDGIRPEEVAALHEAEENLRRLRSEVYEAALARKGDEEKVNGSNTTAS